MVNFEQLENAHFATEHSTECKKILKIGSPGETIVIKTIQNLNVLDDRTKVHQIT